MVDLISIAGIVILIAIGVIALKIFKSIFKAIFLVFSLLAIVMIIFGIILYNDVLDFQTNFPKSEKIMLLKENDVLLGGFTGTFTGGTEPEYIHDLTSHQSYYYGNNLDFILGNKFKLFIVELDAFEDIETIEFGGEEISGDFALSLIKSDNTIEDYADYYIENQDLPEMAFDGIKEQLIERFDTDTGLRGALFGSFFSRAVQEDPLFLFTEYKKGNIIVYKETMLFRILKKVPLILIKRFIPQNGNNG